MGEPGRRIALATLGALTLINLLNYLDRYVVAGIVPDLKGALALSDRQIGSLMTVFMLVYMCAAPGFGIWGDRGGRTRPIALGVALWSLATLVSGLARSFPQLLAGRAAVGIGEAACVAIAPALLADLFRPDARGRALSVFNMAIPVGTALGYVVGGYVSHHYGWRAAFFLAGAPGLLLALGVLRLPDPPRGARDAAPPPGATSAGAGALATYAHLLRRAPYLLLVLGYAAYTFAVGGLAVWMPTFLNRERDIPLTAATTGFGAIIIVCGFLGTFAGGWLGDYWLRWSRQGWLWMSGITTLLAVPCVLLALRSTSPTIFYSAIIAAQLLLFASTGPVSAAVVNVVAAQERASAMALCMFLIHLLGDVPSPLLIGHLSDRSSLAQAVMVVPIAVTACAVLWILAARAAARDAASIAQAVTVPP